MTGTQTTTEYVTQIITKHTATAQRLTARVERLVGDDHHADRIYEAAEKATRARLVADILSDLMQSLSCEESLTEAIETIASNY